MPRPPSSWLIAGTIGAVAVVEAVFGWTLFFSFLGMPYDEGYMVTIYREWIDGGALYDEVYSQYGPFHAVSIGLPFRLFDLPFNLGTGRFITLGLLVGSTVMLAIAALKLTGSLVAAVLAQLLTFWTMSVVITVPLHPVPLLMFVLAGLVANIVVLRPHRPRLSDWITGGLVAAVCLTKANVGLFVVVAMVYVVAAGWPMERTRRWLLPVAEVGFVAVGPVLLLSRRSATPPPWLGDFSGRDPHTVDYWALAYTAAALTVVVFGRLGRAKRPDNSTAFSPARLIAGFGLVSVLSIGAVLLTGTSIRALVDGVLVRPLGQPDALTLFPQMSGEMLMLLIATPLLVAAGWAISRATPGRSWFIASGTLRVIGAMLLLIAASGQLQAALNVTFVAGSFAYVPLVALIVLPRLDSATAPMLNSRSFVAALAVAQSLHAFPVAATQVALALLFPIFCAVVILDDGVREYSAALASVDHERTWRIATSGLTLAVLVWVGWQHQDDMRHWVGTYREAAPLGLANSSWIRADPAASAGLKELVTQVEDCNQLVTYPGDHSLNLRADIPDPNGYNATLWPDLLTDHEERGIVQQLEATDDPVCFAVIRHVGGPPGIDPQGGPLERYLAHFEKRSAGNGYEILVRPA